MDWRKWFQIFPNQDYVYICATMHNDLCLKLIGKEILITDQYKFLSIIYENLSFITHYKLFETKI